MTEAKKPIDWADIERDYRTSPMSVREIARWHGVTEAAIRKRAKKGLWVRPETEAGSQGDARTPPPVKVYVGTVLTLENTTPEAIVERGRALAMRMMDELDASTSQMGELESLIVAGIEGDNEKQREAALAAVSLKNRAEVLKSLATAVKTLADSGAPAGVKKQRQEAGERVARGGGKYAAPDPPRIVQ
jgi:hypothetical protein